MKKGIDSETRKRVALKIMFVECDKNDLTYQQTCHEIKIMRQINKPCVIRLLGYDLHSEYQGKSCVILVQELAPHCELFDYLMHTKKTFSEQLVMYIMKQLFDAIGYMHSMGIAHRDLKPENLLLDKDFNLKVADFGFATYFYKREQRHTLTTELGTRGYMAPEISTHVYNEKCDSFALGVIMFICAAGFPPFRLTEDSDWWFEKIMSKQWNLFWAAHERKAKFSDKCKSLIQQLLAAKPGDRVSVTDAKSHEFLTGQRMMDKTDYVSEMKRRYKIVRAELKKAQSSETQRDENNMADKGDLFDRIMDQEPYFLGAKLLCENNFRAKILQAGDLDTVATEIANLLPSSSTEQTVANFQSVKETIQNYKLDDVKEAYAQCQDLESIDPLLPQEAKDFPQFWDKMNQKLLNDNVAVPVQVIEQYEQLDALELNVVDTEFLQACPNSYRVKYGFGALVHMMKDFATKGSGYDVDVKIEEGMEPYCAVVIPTVEKVEINDVDFIEIAENLEIRLTLKNLDDDLGNVLVFTQFGANNSMTGMDKLKHGMNEILMKTPDLLKKELTY